MATIDEIQKQIDKLIRQKNELVSQEKEQVIEEMREKIRIYGITASELGFRKNAKTLTATTTTKTVKYKNEKGETWGGRGPKPQWVKDVEASGKSLDQYLVA